jgi:BirA family transcriptional regulator, biotin operon repressor / biotin---[acetyl-CoA-carboxylase] ligase
VTTAAGRTALNLPKLRADAKGRWRAIDLVEQTGSTNADLLARAAGGEQVAGRVLLAEYQTAGRGRRGRHWTAPPRSQLAMSVAVDIGGMNPDSWGWLPLLTGIAVADAVDAVCGIRAGLKWPNDLMVGEGKLAGILAEVAARGCVIVVGLGLNVSLTDAEAPTDTATSLAMLGAPGVDRNELAAGILARLAERVARWRAAGGADDALVADYRTASVTLGARVRATLPGDHEIVGTAQDIDSMGRLLIADGLTPTTIAAGDIAHLRLAR